MDTCPACGRTGTISGGVLAFVKRKAGAVHVRDVAQHFGMPGLRASRTLCHLADSGHIVRVSRGVYSADPELQRRALLEQLQRLTPA